MKKQELTLAERINRDRNGRSQSWIIAQMNVKGCKISDAQFSRKKHGYAEFSKNELEILVTILTNA